MRLICKHLCNAKFLSMSVASSKMSQPYKIQLKQICNVDDSWPSIESNQSKADGCDCRWDAGARNTCLYLYLWCHHTVTS